MSLDWPAGYDRTLPEDRGAYPGDISLSHREAFESVVEELERWGATDVRLTFVPESYQRDSNIPHKSADPDDPGVVAYFRREEGRADEGHAIACDSWNTLRENARAIALYARRKRLAERCGVTTAESEFKTTALPSGNDDVGTAVVGQQPHHEVLGVAPDAPDAAVLGAYRELLKERHPDHGGNSEEFQRLQEAKEAMLDA